MTLLEVDVHNRENLGKPLFIDPSETPESVTANISGVIFGRTYLWWVVALGFSFSLLAVFGLALTWLLAKGVGTQAGFDKTEHELALARRQLRVVQETKTRKQKKLARMKSNRKTLM